MKKFDKEHVEQLWFWSHNYSGSFTDVLFDLISKADHVNRQRIKKAFPEYVAVFDMWYQVAPMFLFEAYGIPQRGD